MIEKMIEAAAREFARYCDADPDYIYPDGKKAWEVHKGGIETALKAAFQQLPYNAPPLKEPDYQKICRELIKWSNE